MPEEGFYLAEPSGPTAGGAGVLVMHDWYGLLPHVRGACDELAAAGLVALAPDLYDGRTTTDPEQAEALMGDLDTAKHRARLPPPPPTCASAPAADPSAASATPRAGSASCSRPRPAPSTPPPSTTPPWTRTMPPASTAPSCSIWPRSTSSTPRVLHRTGANGVRWLEVRLPGRPNNSTAWIRKARTTRSLTSGHLVVDLSERRVTVYRRGKAMQSFSSVVGADATPTPRGKFFVEESVRLTRGHVGGPFALGLSARSNVFQKFAGGPGQIAVHGVWNVGGTMGTAASHGCVRLDTASITWIGERIGPGVPATITS